MDSEPRSFESKSSARSAHPSLLSPFAISITTAQVKILKFYIPPPTPQE